MDPTASTAAEITLEFLQEALKFPIEKFIVSPGSLPGDGYICPLYSVDVWKSGQTAAQHLLIKCLPSDARRQRFLLDCGVFATELGMYQRVIPDLITFQENNVDHSSEMAPSVFYCLCFWVTRDVEGVERKIKLPFAPFHAGRVLPNEQGTPSLLDSYIIMTDLRKSRGFRMQDRFQGLDLDHFKLVVEAQATFHAVSWAYKIQRGVSKLLEKFPFLSTKDFQKSYERGGEAYLKQQMEVGANLFKDDPALTAGYDHLRAVFRGVSKLYYNFQMEGHDFTKDSILRQPPATVENEEPWEVLLHGDAWSNNMLFRYDSSTGKPVEVVMVDLQLCREGDPFSDVNYALYAGTDKNMRKEHLASLLHIYYDTFSAICRHFSVHPFPGWSWQELNRRFHRAQIFGVFQAATLLPVLLKTPNEIVEISKMGISKEDMPSEEFRKSDSFQKMSETLKPNPILESRLRGVLEDGLGAGVI